MNIQSNRMNACCNLPGIQQNR